MSSAKLYVEGKTDKTFLQNLINVLNLRLPVDIEPKHGVSNVKRYLETLGQYFKDGTITQLGIIVDADHTGIEDGGFGNRWQQFTQPLVNLKYTIPSSPPSTPYQGSIFTHTNGLPAVGLWLMPDHRNDGMLEDLVKKTVTATQQPILEQAEECVTHHLPANLKLFKSPHRDTKAIIHTWLAWQEDPGQRLGSVIDTDQANHLIELQAPEIQAFITWLKQVFN